MDTPANPEAKPMVSLPYGDAEGRVIPHAGRYARECVLVAFEMIGGVERMASWANDNPGEFYTRLYSKVITKEVDVNASQGVEDMLAKLDKLSNQHSRPVFPGPSPEPIEAEYEVED